MTHQISTQDGNHVQHADSRSDAMRDAQSLADRTRQTVLVSECGADEDDYETIEPTGFRISSEKV